MIKMTKRLMAYILALMCFTLPLCAQADIISEAEADEILKDIGFSSDTIDSIMANDKIALGLKALEPGVEIEAETTVKYCVFDENGEISETSTYGVIPGSMLKITILIM